MFLNYLHTKEWSNNVYSCLFINWWRSTMFGQFNYATRDSLQFSNILTSFAYDSSDLKKIEKCFVSANLLKKFNFKRCVIVPANLQLKSQRLVVRRLFLGRNPLRASSQKSGTVLSTALPGCQQ